MSAAMSAATPADRGSIIPLILGFFLVALLMVGGAVAAADAFAQQRELQDVCDGAAAAAAASAAELERGPTLAGGPALRFGDVQQAVADYLTRDPSRADVRAASVVSVDATVLTLTCTRTSKIAFGAIFGKGRGVHHVVHSSVRAPLS